MRSRTSFSLMQHLRAIICEVDPSSIGRKAYLLVSESHDHPHPPQQSPRCAGAVLGCLLVALLAAAAAGAGTANPSPLTPKRRRGRSPSAACTGATRAAVAVDLQTGEILYKRTRASPHGAGLEREAPDHLRRARTSSAATYRIPTDVLGDGGQVGKTWRGQPRPARPRRSDALLPGSEAPGLDGARRRDPPRDGLDRRRRDASSTRSAASGDGSPTTTTASRRRSRR